MHKSVLLNEVIESLNLDSESIVVDCTLGYGGHSSEILKRIKKGFLFAFDQDDDAIEYSTKRLSEIGDNFKIIKSNFVDIKKYIGEVDGILYDLGVSSPQLDTKERGFSFHNDATLDMRMDKSAKLSAKEVVNNYSAQELMNIFFKYGEEKYAKSIANKIVEYRKNKEIETTLELVDIISSSVPEKYKREHHPARKVFQAIRIYVNEEISELENAVRNAIDSLNVGGRLCIITFHSLEDRIVKEVFNEEAKSCICPPDFPTCVCGKKSRIKLVNRKPILPSDEELENNLRAHSAKLRVAEKI